ncbi:hypothetical protein GCM10023085_01320 [Actinomadura viridis]|uniref:Uncharacterized protein n=1 Tax=Actinomadura viridis TaxID=58110 RepID=A0A931DK71_9ACTN|nr:hypothetical protein [Actinomadura viridis]
MEFAALGAWILAAIAGTYLLAVWLANGGLRRQATKVTRFPTLIVVGHPVSAALGLAVWVAYMATGRAGYAWTAFCVLLLIVLQGFVLFTRWLVGRGGRHARGAEQAFPATAVLLHGTVAVATVVLVFLSAIQVSRR